MGRLALQGSPRLLLVRLHRWSALAALTMIGVAGLTGSVLVFREPLDRRLNPRLHLVVPAGAPLRLDRIIDLVESRAAHARVGTITLPAQPNRSLIAYLPGRELFVDPYSGAILGERGGGRMVLDREHVIPLLVRLHYTLLLGPTGAWLMGIAAVLWFWTSLAGAAIAWPSSWRSPAAWGYAIQLRTTQGLWVATWDLHRAIGLALLPIWLALAATSIYLAFPSGVRSIVARVSPLIDAPIPHSSWTGQPLVSPDVAIARALAAVPNSRAFGITRDFSHGRYSVRLVLDGDVNPAGNSQAYIDFATGHVLAVQLSTHGSPGQRFLYWQFPLHSGEAFGQAGRAAVALSGLATVAMGASGFFLWWRGSRARRLPTKTSKETRQ